MQQERVVVQARAEAAELYPTVAGHGAEVVRLERPGVGGRDRTAGAGDQVRVDLKLRLRERADAEEVRADLRVRERDAATGSRQAFVGRERRDVGDVGRSERRGVGDVVRRQHN